jgi:hypothetical protein
MTWSLRFLTEKKRTGDEKIAGFLQGIQSKQPAGTCREQIPAVFGWANGLDYRVGKELKKKPIKNCHGGSGHPIPSED